MFELEAALQFPPLSDAINRAARQRGGLLSRWWRTQRRDRESIISKLEDELASAAQQYFGSRFRFKGKFNAESGELELFEVVTVVDANPAEGEGTVADCKAHGIDVEPGDVLLFEIFYRPEQSREASRHDRDLHAVTGLRTAGSGFALAALAAIRRVLGMPVADPAVLAAVTDALTLAALPAPERSSPGVLRRYRLRHAFEGLVLRRVYVVDAEGLDGITTEEATELLGVAVPAPGDRIEVTADLIPLNRLLLGLLDTQKPGRPLAAADAGATPVAGALVELGIDLVRREIRGQPWLQLPTGQSWSSHTAVEAVREPADEILLADAVKLAPDARLGQKLRFPQVGHALPALATLLPNGTHDQGSKRPYNVEAFEALRTLLHVMPTPPSLAPFELGPLRRLFPEGHGVLFAEVPSEHAERIWRQLDAKANETGFRPILLGGSERELKEVPLAWRDAKNIPGLQRATHAAIDPSTVLSEVDGVDVAALLEPGGNPSHPDLKAEQGDWPESVQHEGLSCSRGPADNEPKRRIRLALIPTDAAWKAVAWMPQLLQAGEATPSMTQLVAVARRWEEQFGARIAVIQPATVEWIVARPPASREEALRIAREHFTFSPDGGAPLLEHRAAELMQTFWYAWWD